MRLLMELVFSAFHPEADSDGAASVLDYVPFIEERYMLERRQ
jgi:hypothetical protein